MFKIDNSINILAVDDEPVNMQVLSNIFKVHNISIVKAYNGNQALEFIDSERKPDIILLDIMMPGMNGYELCGIIREKYPANQLPVIMLTAKNQITDLVNALDAGANDYLVKPAPRGVLVSHIKKLVRASRQ